MLVTGESWDDVLNYVVPEPRAGDDLTVWVSITPDLMYTKSLEHLLGRLRNPHPPDPPLAGIYSRARQLDTRIWGMLQTSGDPKHLDPVTRMLRAEALDVLREWFTEFLSRAMGLGVDRRLGIHITPKDLRYRM